MSHIAAADAERHNYTEAWSVRLCVCVCLWYSVKIVNQIVEMTNIIHQFRWWMCIMTREVVVLSLCQNYYIWLWFFFLLLFHWIMFRNQSIHDNCEIIERTCALQEPHGSLLIKDITAVLQTQRTWSYDQTYGTNSRLLCLGQRLNKPTMNGGPVDVCSCIPVYLLFFFLLWLLLEKLQLFQFFGGLRPFKRDAAVNFRST